MRQDVHLELQPLVSALVDVDLAALCCHLLQYVGPDGGAGRAGIQEAMVVPLYTGYQLCQGVA